MPKQGVLFKEISDISEVQSTSELANPWALDCNGTPILPKNAVRHGIYTCPKCQEPLKIRKRGKGKRSRRDHFCHLAHTACKGFSPHETESYIHKTAKEGIYKIIQSCIDNQESYPISWTCPTCGKQFSGNLLHHVKSIMIEKQFEDKTDGQEHKQPDISLVDENGKLLVAIEIVYTHDIEPETWSFYDANNIVVIRLKFDTVEEPNNLHYKLQNPDSVNICLNATCKECQTMHQPRRLKLHKDRAGQYFFFVSIHNPFDDNSILGVPFNEDEIQQAKSYVKKKSQLYSVEEHHNDTGFHYARIVEQQRVQQPIVRRPLPRRTYLTIDELEARSYFGPRKYRSGKYQYKSSTNNKKSFGTRKNEGKRRK